MRMSHDTHKKALEELLKTVTEELQSVGIHNPENESDWVAIPPEGSDEPDMNDVADNAEEWEERASTLALLETRWNNVRRALRKIDTDSFGICEVCGEPIEEERLAANSAARTCITDMEEETTLPL